MGRRKRKKTDRAAEVARPPARLAGNKFWLILGAMVLGTGLVAIALRDSSPPTTADSTENRVGDSPTLDDRPADSPVASRQKSPSWKIVEVGQDLPHQENWREIDNPAADGWETEAQHLAIKKQLNKIGKKILDPRGTAEKLAPLLTSDFTCKEIVPKNRETAVQTALLTVERSSAQATSEDTTAVAGYDSQGAATFSGAAGLLQAVRESLPFIDRAEELRFEFKIIGIDASDQSGSVPTEELFSLFARTEQGLIEQHATWRTVWALEAGKQKPRLKSIVVTDFEQTTTHNTAAPLMSDCTEAALASNRSYREQLAYGVNHWLDRIPFRTMLNLFGMPGLAIGDVNGDGLEDVYLCQDPGIPNLLFLQQPDGTLRDVSREWGVDWIEDARSALLVDLDNDGDQDLIVAIRSGVVLASNEENQRFKLRDVLPISEDATSLAAADYDSDGRLDIYACVYKPDELLQTSSGASMGAALPQFVLHDANNGAANTLFRNMIEPDASWRFLDVTEEIGLDVNNRRWSLAAAWEDYDNDGDQDLYVANDYGRDNLYRNDVDAEGRRRFVDVGDASHVESSAAGMAIAWGDYDRDGWMDAYVSNMFSSAGHRITTQARFKPDASQEVRQRLQHFASGNTLLRNVGNGTFANRSQAARVAMGRWAWGNAFLDLDNDGWEDLIVANGYMTTDDTGDL